MLTLHRATTWAQLLQEKLAPHCAQIAIAGSIRRGRPMVGDIDLVILPKSEQARQQIPAIFLSSPLWQSVQEGPQNCIYRRTLADRTELQLDIFFARPASTDLFSSTPTNFGSLLLCRTGSKEHNIYLVEHAKKLGLKWKPYQGVFDASGKCLASATEQEIFAALQLDYITPEHRERP